jgi:hypothetical protein
MKWLARYDPGVPRSLVPYPETTLLELLAETARRRPDHPFILFEGARLGAGALERLSDAFAAALLRELPPGEVGEVLIRAPQLIPGIGGTRRRRPGPCGGTGRAGPGSTPATLAAWTRTAFCSSWTARRT